LSSVLHVPPPPLFFVYIFGLALSHSSEHLHFEFFFPFGFSFLYAFSFWGVFVVVWLAKGALGLGFFGYLMTKRRVVVVSIFNIIIILANSN
jgi:hypothetical protein